MKAHAKNSQWTVCFFSVCPRKVTFFIADRHSDFNRNDCCDGISPRFPYILPFDSSRYIFIFIFIDIIHQSGEKIK